MILEPQSKKAVRPNKSDSARVIQVVEVKTTRGRGTADEPFSAVVEYWSLEGELLAVREFE